MWAMWPLLHEAYNDWAGDYLENILVPLDNFITRGTETFLTCQNPNYLQQVRLLTVCPGREIDERQGINSCCLLASATGEDVQWPLK